MRNNSKIQILRDENVLILPNFPVCISTPVAFMNVFLFSVLICLLFILVFCVSFLLIIIYRLHYFFYCTSLSFSSFDVIDVFLKHFFHFNHSICFPSKKTYGCWAIILLFYSFLYNYLVFSLSLHYHPLNLTFIYQFYFVSFLFIILSHFTLRFWTFNHTPLSFNVF